MDELKPCPFCNKPPITTPSGEGGNGLMIECLTEGCVNPHVSYYNHDVARTAWNTRAASGGLNEPFGNPEQFDVNEHSGNSRQLASLEQRAREVVVTDVMVDAYLAAQAKVVQEVDDQWGNGGKAASYLHPVREACRAGLTAALANQQGVGADALRYAAYFRWLMRGKNLELAAALMATDQYATLRRLCESLVPLDDAHTQPAGDVGSERA